MTLHPIWVLLWQTAAIIFFAVPQNVHIMLLAFISIAVPYEPLRNLTGKVMNSTSIFIEWNPIDLPNIRGILRGYAVYYKEAPGSAHPSVMKNITVPLSVTNTLLSNLHKFTAYSIWVTAFTIGNGPLSNSLLAWTYEDSKFKAVKYSYVSF